MKLHCENQLGSSDSGTARMCAQCLAFPTWYFSVNELQFSATVTFGMDANGSV
jgi:hypothetical protein